ncbi:putative bifunctional diguanylate cyclase/phosphodiesterase [Microcella sp.]|uniref:putative bifunctional diguanylate cyclase/phosphodiesterase n=1 Tax=Microcella sp. TaxID=1913979 RepID=UPI003918DBB2
MTDSTLDPHTPAVTRPVPTGLAPEVSPLLLARALETVSEGSLITDAHRNTIYSNSAFTSITGYRQDEIVGTNCRFLQGPQTSPETIQHIRDALSAGTVFQGTILNYRKDGSTFWNHLTITPLFDDEGQVTNFVSVQRDVTDSVEERERLSHAASHDPLTGLPNREGTRRLLRRSLTSADESGAVVAVGLLDLDHFKAINDDHGHPAGDEVLIELGARIRGALRRNDHVARPGGDEFVLIVADLDPDRATQQFADVARRIRAEIVRPMTLSGGVEVAITTSMGVAMYPTDGVDSRSLYAAADRALYTAKERRGAVDWYELATPAPSAPPTMPTDATAEERFDYQGAPAHHVEGTLTMFMQPIVDLQTGSVTQFEALARIRRPDGSLLMPDQFLPNYTPEQLHEVFWIGIHNALDWVARWQERGHELSVSVNVPPELFASPDSAQLVIDALELTGVDPSRLSLELLETREIELSASDEAIDELVRLGVKLHLDDISSGYSTLKRVTELPFDVIKIDRHIFDNIHTRALHVITVLAAITKLGADFGYGVTVEGIENRERLEVSAVLGAHFGQGYLFARPMPPEDVVDWIESVSVPVVADRITTALGALAYHWSRMRGDGSQHPPRERCPLTAFFAGADRQISEVHDRMHDDPEGNAEAATLLTSWLMEEAAGRH